MKTKRKFMFLVLLVVFCFFSIAYARLTTSLNIRNSAGIKSASWSVYFSSLAVSKTGNAVINNNPSIDKLVAINDFSMTLTGPGDSVILTFDVVNDGTLDAKISNFSLGNIEITAVGSDNDVNDVNTVRENLTYKLTYTNDTTIEQTGEVINAGDEVSINQKLLSGQKVNLTLTLSYDGVNLPRDKVNINISDTEVFYSQYISNS